MTEPSLDVPPGLGDVDDALRGLNTRERELLRMRFGIGRPVADLQEVSSRFGISQARARQIEARALSALRTHALCQSHHATGARRRRTAAVSGLGHSRLWVQRLLAMIGL